MWWPLVVRMVAGGCVTSLSSIEAQVIVLVSVCNVRDMAESVMQGLPIFGCDGEHPNGVETD